MSLRTPLHTILPSIRVPLVVGPMANACGGALTAAVSSAGGFGYLGAGYYDATKLQSELDVIHSVLGEPSGTQRLEVGVGFLGWNLTKQSGGSISNEESTARNVIDTALKARPRSIWLSFCTDSEELVGWSKVVRQREEALNGKGKELKLAVNVGSLEEARVACESAGADLIIVQGIEAGGHGLGTSPPLTSLLPLVRASLPTWKISNPSGTTPALLGAGGHHSASSLVATLALGGDGSVYGTRFLLTPEAAYSRAQKDVLLSAKEGQTIRTLAFDEARGTTSWPKDVDGRGIYNDTVRDYQSGQGSTEERQALYKRAEGAGDVKRIITWAGTGVGNMDVIKPAAEVVREIEVGAIEGLKRLRGYMQ